MDKTNVSPVGESWISYREKHDTQEERAENDFPVDLVGEVIQARKERNISQSDKQPVIARLENGKTDSQSIGLFWKIRWEEYRMPQII